MQDKPANGSLKQKRGFAHASVTRFKSYIMAFDAKQNLTEELELRMERVPIAEAEWHRYHEEILSTEDDIDMNEENNRVIEFEDLVLEVLARARKILQDLRKSSDQGSADGSHTTIIQHHYRTAMGMAPINLTPFHSNPLDWMRYKEMFIVIMNKQQPPLEPLEKFLRLKETVHGDALMMIDPLSYCDESFEIAWNILCKKYENIYLLVSLLNRKLINLVAMKNESGEELARVTDTVTTTLAALKSLKQESNWEMMLVSLVTPKIDNNSRMQWEFQLVPNTLPTWKQMETFLQQRAAVLSASSQNSSPLAVVSRRLQNYRLDPIPKKAMAHLVALSCPHCQQDHIINQCEQFMKLDLKQKLEVVSATRLCYNCLRGDHMVRHCTSSRCKKCNSPHHTLLHREEHSQPSVKSSFSGHAHHNKRVLLATAIVFIRDSHGQRVPCRALLDIGSTEHFATERLVQLLKLKKTRTMLPIGGVNLTTSFVTASVEMSIESRTQKAAYKIKCLVVPKITGDLPCYAVDTRSWKMPSHIKMADPSFERPQQVDLLIGGGLFGILLKHGKIELADGQPVLLNTTLGWVVTGTTTLTRTLPFVPQPFTAVCGLVSNAQLSEQLELMYKLEGIEREDTITEAGWCEKHFVENVSRKNDGNTDWRAGMGSNDSSNDRGDREGRSERRPFNRNFGNRDGDRNRDAPDSGDGGNWRGETGERPTRAQMADSSPPPPRREYSGRRDGDRNNRERPRNFERREQEPMERPKITIAPRTLPMPELIFPTEDEKRSIRDENKENTEVEKEPPKPKPVPVPAANIFGQAKPVDTAAREREFEERIENDRLKKIEDAKEARELRDKEEAEQKIIEREEREKAAAESSAVKMSTQIGKKNKKSSKKNKNVSLQDFLGATASAGTVIAQVPVNRSWGDECGDKEDTIRTQIELPTAPRASRMLNDDSIPTSPPFQAYLSNLPYDLVDEEIVEFFLEFDIPVKSVRLPRDDNDSGRLRGYGYVEFETREDLIEAVSLPDPTLRNRRIRVGVSSENDNKGRQNRGDRGNRNYDNYNYSSNITATIRFAKESISQNLCSSDL